MTTSSNALTSRYRYVTLPPDHPIASPSGKIPLHRLLLWERIGDGPHPCHWGCGTTLTWQPGAHTKDGALTTDHIDNDGRNNVSENLVPSCHTCNVRRARDHRFKDQLFVVHPKTGVREKATERTCEFCRENFLIATKFLRSAEKHGKKNVARFCSNDCKWQRPKS